MKAESAELWAEALSDASKHPLARELGAGLGWTSLASAVLAWMITQYGVTYDGTASRFSILFIALAACSGVCGLILGAIGNRPKAIAMSLIALILVGYAFWPGHVQY